MRELTFDQDGAQRFCCALSNSDVRSVLAAVEHLPTNAAGVRIGDAVGLVPLLTASGAVGMIADGLIGPGAFPVRAVLFDKSESLNWSLAWHQDRTIVVRQRIETSGYGPWSTKAGLLHVAPPFEALASMATLRVHLDPVDEDNAPLLIAPGSHRMGRVTVAQVPAVIAGVEPFACLAEAGDVWAYATPILHASEAARRPVRRRVLQVDYAAKPLDGGLEWLGLFQGDS